MSMVAATRLGYSELGFYLQLEKIALPCHMIIYVKCGELTVMVFELEEQDWCLDVID